MSNKFIFALIGGAAALVALVWWMNKYKSQSPSPGVTNTAQPGLFIAPPSQITGNWIGTAYGPSLEELQGKPKAPSQLFTGALYL